MALSMAESQSRLPDDSAGSTTVAAALDDAAVPAGALQRSPAPPRAATRCRTAPSGAPGLEAEEAERAVPGPGPGCRRRKPAPVRGRQRERMKKYRGRAGEVKPDPGIERPRQARVRPALTAGARCSVRWSGLAHVRRLQALRPLDDVELHRSPSARERKPSSDGGVVDEDVLPAFLGDEAETLRIVEPLHGTLRHCFYLGFGAHWLRSAPGRNDRGKTRSPVPPGPAWTAAL